MDIDEGATARDLMAEIARLRGILAQHEEKIRGLEKRVLDIEAARFADVCERDLDLARWGDVVAETVGEDLEEVAGLVTDAMELSRAGHDVTQYLSGIHAALRCTIDNLQSVGDIQE